MQQLERVRDNPERMRVVRTVLRTFHDHPNNLILRIGGEDCSCRLAYQNGREQAIVIHEKELDHMDVDENHYESMKIIALRLLNPQEDSQKKICTSLLAYLENNNRGANALHVIVPQIERNLFDFYVRHGFRAIHTLFNGTVLFKPMRK